MRTNLGQPEDRKRTRKGPHRQKVQLYQACYGKYYSMTMNHSTVNTDKNGNIYCNSTQTFVCTFPWSKKCSPIFLLLSATTALSCPDALVALTSPQSQLATFQLTFGGETHSLMLPLGRYPYNIKTNNEMCNITMIAEGKSSQLRLSSHNSSPATAIQFAPLTPQYGTFIIKKHQDIEVSIKRTWANSMITDFLPTNLANLFRDAGVHMG